MLKRLLIVCSLFALTPHLVNGADRGSGSRGDSTLLPFQLHLSSDFASDKVAVISPSYQRSTASQILSASLPLVVTGFVAMPFDKEFFNMRQDYIPSFKYSYDDYLQYSPAAIMLALKGCGVEGRSSWGRMLTADAFSAGIMAAMVNSLKYTVGRERPDGSHNNSFPSGHTATAFMCATMLHKEYGQTRSPLYSLLGYSLATATAASRLMNNKHWMSDLLVGAGIGIASTELAYYLTSLIFKEKGLKHDLITGADSDYFLAPNFLKIDGGYSFILQSAYFGNGIGIEAKGGASVEVSGAWFLTQNLGFGLKVGAVTSPYEVDSDVFSSYRTDRMAISSSLRVANVSPTVNFSYPLNYGVLLGCYLSPSININSNQSITSIDTQGVERTEVAINRAVNMGAAAGVSATKMLASNFGCTLFVNYNAVFANVSGYYNSFSDQKRSYSNRSTMQFFTIGASASAFLFRDKN